MQHGLRGWRAGPAIGLTLVAVLAGLLGARAGGAAPARTDPHRTGRGAAPAVDGNLDPSFGNGGVVTTSFPGGFDLVFTAVQQADGKILVGGQSFGRAGLARYLPDGTLDPSFGQGGLVRWADGTPVPGGLSAILVEPDGTILAGGDLTVLRLLPDGRLDPSFGSAGIATAIAIQAGCSSQTALQVEPDGEILVACSNPGVSFAAFLPNGQPDLRFGDAGNGTQFTPGPSFAALAFGAGGTLVGTGYAYLPGPPVRYDLQLGRYLIGGTPDPSFGQGGVAQIAFADHSAFGLAIGILPDWRIVAAGRTTATDYYQPSHLAAWRLTPSGALDPSFGGSGEVTRALGADSQAWGLALGAGGTLTLAGYTTATTGPTALPNYALLRLAPNGTLDPTFGSGGIVTTTFGVASLAVAPLVGLDGRLFVAGDARTVPRAQQAEHFALAAYGPGGVLDPAFGHAGLVTTAFPAGRDRAAALALQPDGRIVAAGQTNDDQSAAFAVARYTPDGRLDPTFGNLGQVTTLLLGSGDAAHAVTLQPDGRILVAGGALAPLPGQTVPTQFGVVRYLPDGRLDPSFGAGGSMVTTIPGYSATANAVALAPDGRIVLAGNAAMQGLSAVALVRYLPDGHLDAGFGSGGVVTTQLGSGFAGSGANAVAVLPDGRIVIAGFGSYTTPCWPHTCSGNNVLLARYLPDGRLDTTFGSGGAVQGRQDATAAALGLAADGRLVVAGSSVVISPTMVGMDFWAARYQADGSPDLTFGGPGGVSTDIAGGRDEGHAVLAQVDGRVVVAGTYNITSGSGQIQGGGLALVRYQPDGQLDSGFGAGGIVTTTLGIDRGAAGLAQQADGRLVAAGVATTALGGADFALVRYLAPAPIPPGCLFADVCPVDYFFTPVQNLVGRGVVAGYADNTFRPYSNATRGQVAKMVVLAGGWPINTQGGPHFADVPPTQPFYPYIETIYNRGVVSGYADGLFHPAAAMTRGQLSKVLVLAAGWPITPPPAPHFTDVPPTHPFYGAIETAVAHGILSGYADGTFRPANAATRGQIAKLVAGALPAAALKGGGTR
ncbi:MAG TPA: S-layer homology domain-containing protein [Chloroflexia bacterium]|nr:S-layer homology domain-containing protein [Chloroflexia bacterium]